MSIRTKTNSFIEVLEQVATTTPNKNAFTYLRNGEVIETITYEELVNEAKRLAGFMQHHGYEGKRAIIMYPSSISYIKIFIACMFANVTAIPANPPTLSNNMDRIRNIMNHSSADLLFTTASLRSRLNRLINNTSKDSFTWLCLDEIKLPNVNTWSVPNLNEKSVSFLQYTSGSTSAPKGVMVTHKNILYNEEMIKNAFGTTKDSIILGWLPLYHDMGLIGNVLHPLYLGGTGILMDPMDFLQKPSRWLKAISDFKADVSGGPNFAYELCRKKITDSELNQLNLESWEVAFNGAEPVRSETLKRFYQRFSHSGFKYNSLYPCYGMAEATLLISGGKRLEKPKIKNFDSEGLKLNKAKEVKNHTINTTSLVSCGTTSLKQIIQIVDPDTQKICPNNKIGEIWVKGENVANGYLHNENSEDFSGVLEGEDGFYLQTGDLGFIQESNVFVTGRKKDLIVIRGKNFYPQDIEKLVEETKSCIRTGCSAAFCITHENEEKLVIVAEIDRKFRPRKGQHKRDFNQKDIFSLIRKNIMQEFGVQPFAIHLIKTGSIPKTSSGKIRRNACKQSYETNNLITWYMNTK